MVVVGSGIWEGGGEQGTDCFLLKFAELFHSSNAYITLMKITEMNGFFS